MFLVCTTVYSTLRSLKILLLSIRTASKDQYHTLQTFPCLANYSLSYRARASRISCIYEDRTSFSTNHAAEAPNTRPKLRKKPVNMPTTPFSSSVTCSLMKMIPKEPR
jgi:hypothetical protein